MGNLSRWLVEEYRLTTVGPESFAELLPSYGHQTSEDVNINLPHPPYASSQCGLPSIRRQKVLDVVCNITVQSIMVCRLGISSCFEMMIQFLPSHGYPLGHRLEGPVSLFIGSNLTVSLAS